MIIYANGSLCVPVCVAACPRMYSKVLCMCAYCDLDDFCAVCSCFICVDILLSYQATCACMYTLKFMNGQRTAVSMAL